MTEETFLKGFVKRSLAKKTTATSSPYSQTIPANSCYYDSTTGQNYPISRYAGYGVKAWEVLYSIYVANQSTAAAKFTYNQALNYEPTIPSACTGPANIFIIRHGEKNSGADVTYELNYNGIYRACQIIDKVNKLAIAGTPISYIITCLPCPYNSTDSSMRPQQTIGFTSLMLNIPIFMYAGSQDYSFVKTELFNSGIFDGLNVLICWEHTAIQQLCLNIVNTAATLSSGSRLPAVITQGTDGYSDWYGDAYFKQFSQANGICPDGNYLAPSGTETSFYINGPDYPGQLQANGESLPLCIGPNSAYYPYWNTNNFESLYCFSSSALTNYVFTFKLFKENAITCYKNCVLNIGLYQPQNTQCTPGNKYTNEGDCEVPPASWDVTEAN
jgi:hypothetical protein